MRVQRIDIRDLYGTRHASFAPGTVTVLSGENQSGKSSIIKALLGLFAGGHDPSALRIGAKKGSVALTLDNGAFYTKTVTDKRSSTEAFNELGEAIPAPQTKINELADLLSVDPARLLVAKPKELVGALLDIMPLAFSPEEIREALGNHAARVDIPSVPIDLDGIDALRKQAYERRTRCNTIARDAEGTENDLKKALPPDDGKDWRAEVDRLQSERNDIEAAKIVELDAIQRELEKSIDTINAQAERMREKARVQAADSANKVRDAAHPLLQDNASHIAVARENLGNKARLEVLRKQIEDARQKVAHNNAESMRYELTIDAIDALKKRKLESLPIPGLEVRGDRVLYEGVAFEHVNTAKRVEIAFLIAAQRAGKLPFMVIDNAELMDSETWKAFVDGARISGFQVIAARVGDGPLTIERVDEPALTLQG